MERGFRKKFVKNCKSKGEFDAILEAVWDRFWEHFGVDFEDVLGREKNNDFFRLAFHDVDCIMFMCNINIENQ